MLKPIFSLLMLLFIASTLAAQISSFQTSIYFDEGKKKLSPKNEADIKDFLKKASNADDFELIAYIYTDSLENMYNFSRLRLDTLRVFLKTQGFANPELHVLKTNKASLDPKKPSAELRNSHNKVELKLLSIQPHTLNDMYSYFDEKCRETIFYSNRQDTIIGTTSSTTLRVKANSFVQKNGQAAVPPIRIELRYLSSYIEMGRLKISTLSDGKALNTQLVFNISAFDAKNNALELASDKKIEVVIGVNPSVASGLNIFTADRAATDFHSPINWKATTDTFAFAPHVKTRPSLLYFFYRSMEGASLDGTIVPFPTRPVYKVGLPPIAPKPNNASTYAAAVQKYKADSLAYAQENAAAFAYSDSIAAAMFYMVVESNASRYTRIIMEQIEQCDRMKAQINYYDQMMAAATALGFDDIAKEFAEHKQKLINNIDGGKIADSMRRGLVQSCKTPLFNAFLPANIDQMQIFKPKANAVINYDKPASSDDYQRNYQHNNRNTPNAPTFEAYCESFYKRVGYSIYNDEFLNAMIAIQRQANTMGFETKLQNALSIGIAAHESTEKLKARLNDLGYISGSNYITRRTAQLSHLGWFALAEIINTILVPTVKIRLNTPVSENTYFYASTHNTNYPVSIVDNAYEISAPQGFPKNVDIMIRAVSVVDGNLFVVDTYGRPAELEKMKILFSTVKLNSF